MSLGNYFLCAVVILAPHLLLTFLNRYCMQNLRSGFYTHLRLFSEFELYRMFSTRRGIVSVVTFAVVWYFILFYPLRFAASVMVQEKQAMHGLSFFDFIGLGAYQNWSVPELNVFWHFGLFIFPMLSITLAADQTCSDRERGTLRFLSLRSSRNAIFFGRFAGVILIQLLFILFAGLSAFGLALYRDSAQLSIGLQDLTIILLNLLLVILPFNAMMAALSASVKSVRQATLWAILIWACLSGLINLLSYYLPSLIFLKILIPGEQLTELAHLNAWQTLQLADIPLLQSLVLLSVGRWILARQPL